jgi:hypothetical protein
MLMGNFFWHNFFANVSEWACTSFFWTRLVNRTDDGLITFDHHTLCHKLLSGQPIYVAFGRQRQKLLEEFNFGCYRFYWYRISALHEAGTTSCRLQN